MQKHAIEVLYHLDEVNVLPSIKVSVAQKCVV